MAQGAAKKIKPRKKSVLKRIRQTVRRAEVNRGKSTRVRSAMKKLRGVLSAGDAATAARLLPETLAAIDHALKHGILHENTANRYKSRLSLAFNKVAAAKTA
jgi:small subunit ribosomal protein S20